MAFVRVLASTSSLCEMMKRAVEKGRLLMNGAGNTRGTLRDLKGLHGQRGKKNGWNSVCFNLVGDLGECFGARGKR